ncbi:MAG TPA: putative Ig domain-containing protein, partial [Planctomycetota bacterium]|nr:putative Ig domain-containing protein [Planctomycetota bacterium]
MRTWACLAVIALSLAAGCGGGSGGGSGGSDPVPPQPPVPNQPNPQPQPVAPQTRPSGLAITPGSLPYGLVGTAYSVSLAASGASPVQWSVTGSLPGGLALATVGPGAASNTIRGNPKTAGTFSFTVQAQDATGATAQQSYSLVILAPGTPLPAVLTLSPPAGTSLPKATVGQSYSTPIVVTSGGAAPYTFSTFGFFPPGLSIATLSPNSFTISGTPTLRGSFSVAVAIQDAAQTSEVETFSLSVQSGGTPTFTVMPWAGSNLSSGTVRVAYSQTITVTSGGASPYMFTAVSLPAGLTIASTTSNSFTIAGTPRRAGASLVQVTVQDANQLTETESFNLSIAPAKAVAISPTVLPDGNVGDPYNQTLTLVNATGSVQWSLAGSLPTGLVFTNLGNVQGQLASAGSWSFTVQAMDSTGASALQS